MHIRSQYCKRGKGSSKNMTNDTTKKQNKMTEYKTSVNGIFFLYLFNFFEKGYRTSVVFLALQLMGSSNYITVILF